MLLLSISSCRTLSPEVVPQATHDTLVATHLKIDSVYIHSQSTERLHPSSPRYDTLAKLYLRVDTLYRDRVKTETRYRVLRDTTYIHRTDTIPKVVTVTKTEHKIPRWSQFLNLLGVLFLILLLRRLLTLN